MEGPQKINKAADHPLSLNGPVTPFWGWRPA